MKSDFICRCFWIWLNTWIILFLIYKEVYGCWGQEYLLIKWLFNLTLCILVQAPFWHLICINFLHWCRLCTFFGTSLDKFTSKHHFFHPLIFGRDYDISDSVLTLCILVQAPFWHLICINFLQWCRVCTFFGTTLDKFTSNFVLI